MAHRFWFSLNTVFLIPIVALCLGGMVFLTDQQNQKNKSSVKKRLSKEQEYYSKKLDKYFEKVTKDVHKLVTSKSLSKSKLVSHVALVDFDNKYKELVLPKKPEEAQGFLQALNKIEDKRTSSAFWVHASPNEKNSKPDLYVVFDHFPSYWQGPRDVRVVARIKQKPSFKSKRQLVVDQENSVIFGGTLPLALSKNLGFLKRTLSRIEEKAQYLQISKKTQKSHSQIFYLKRWRGTNLVFINRGQLHLPFLAWTDHSLMWLFFCSLILVFLFSTLWLFVHPLFHAYKELKQGFIHFSKEGKMPESLASSRNPFLYFYKNWGMLSSNRESLDTKDTSSTATSGNPSFEEVLDEVTRQLQNQFPSFSVEKHLEYDTQLLHFAPFMKKILKELLKNAIEAMGSLPNQVVKVRSSQKDDLLVFSVQDQGAGIDVKDQDRIFELYYSTKSQMGVGLSLVQSIVSANRGLIELVPEEQGLHLRVSLPLECFLLGYPVKSSQAKAHQVQAPH